MGDVLADMIRWMLCSGSICQGLSPSGLRRPRGVSPAIALRWGSGVRGIHAVIKTLGLRCGVELGPYATPDGGEPPLRRHPANGPILGMVIPK